MALSVGDIISLEDRQTFLGETMVNVYYYQVDTLESLVELDDIAAEWQAVVMNTIQAVQSGAVEHVRLVLRNLTNGIDIHELPLTGEAGAIGGDAYPSLVALSIRLVRATAVTRHGSKRIGGLPEANFNGNTPAAGAVANIDAMADAIGGVFEKTGTVDEDFTLLPVIIGRVHEPAANAGELDLSVVNPVTGGQFIRVTSQTSRRAGRGI